MKQIGLAIYELREQQHLLSRSAPWPPRPAQGWGAWGNNGFTWRVLILPQLEQNATVQRA